MNAGWSIAAFLLVVAVALLWWFDLPRWGAAWMTRVGMTAGFTVGGAALFVLRITANVC